MLTAATVERRLGSAPERRAARVGGRAVAGFGTGARLLALGTALLGGLAAGCATTDEGGKALTYSLTAKQNYEQGLGELKDENFIEATRYFNFVKQKFPFSKFAVLAELALADTQFARGNYQEAIDAYKTFARLHPTHEKVEDGYVAFKVAECYVKDMPGDWFLIPPSAEKDQSAVRDAYRELSDFLDKYPDSTYAKEARKYRLEVVGRLIDHELYVARFYLDQGHPKAAILRIDGALRRFSDSGREAELLLLLGQTQLEMGNPAQANETFQRVVKEYGAGSEARRARLYLDFIKQRFGEQPAAGGTSHG